MDFQGELGQAEFTYL